MLLCSVFATSPPVLKFFWLACLRREIFESLATLCRLISMHTTPSCKKFGPQLDRQADGPRSFALDSRKTEIQQDHESRYESKTTSSASKITAIPAHSQRRPHQ
ncbi:hypothetical protein LshimejAT787_1105340 [Lyophyllum shimeji]|uniref:Uncharacterized protein n=1 Tax=Lyophyllum shimeji TaxID=47721 RepID=A0A9P3UPA1_LYOSH|nr:hypothetical protein LshimejAT787_1105340 [Lyophyllum shimeji]